MKLNISPKGWYRSADKFGNVDVRSESISTLRGAPDIVDGYFTCKINHLTSLEYSPKIVRNYYNCEMNKLASLHNVHLHIKEIHFEMYFSCQSLYDSEYTSTGVPTNLLGLSLIKGLRAIYSGNYIIDNLFAQYGRDLNLFQDALLDAGYVNQAKL